MSQMVLVDRKLLDEALAMAQGIEWRAERGWVRISEHQATRIRQAFVRLEFMANAATPVKARPVLPVAAEPVEIPPQERIALRAVCREMAAAAHWATHEEGKYLFFARQHFDLGFVQGFDLGCLAQQQAQRGGGVSS